jgi:hypothetical protein
MSQPLRVTELWRYPVKSLEAERLDAAMVTGDGLDGERRYAIFDLDTGLGLTAPVWPPNPIMGAVGVGSFRHVEFRGAVLPPRRTSGCPPRAGVDGHTPAPGHGLGQLLTGSSGAARSMQLVRSRL